MNYKYGKEISYEHFLVEPEDFNNLQAFSCGNEKLDKYIHEELIHDNVVDNQDGLAFKVIDKSNEKIIGIVSLAASGIVYQVTNYMHVYPAIKIDVFAIDKQYQKLHYDEESENAEKNDDHYYFSDDVMGSFITYCREISEKHVAAHYIVLYADKKAYRFYQRNLFADFNEFMVKEQNMEIAANIPMYMLLD